MSSKLLSALAGASVLERCANRDASFLRVTPRFLSHAEETGLRLRHRGIAATPAAVLATALTTWDGYRHDPGQGANVLAAFLEDRGQLGILRPVFPVLEQFAQVVA